MHNLSLLQIAITQVVGKKNQAWCARRLRIDGPKMTLMMRGDRGLSSLDEGAARAFTADFPLLDALLPSGWERDISIEVNAAGAMAVARLVAAALPSARSDRERWVWHRLAARAELQAGVDYEFDADEGGYHLMASLPRLQRAREHFRALDDLSGILPHRESVVRLAVRQNLLAVDMLQEKATGNIVPDSPTLAGYRALLDELAAVYRERQSDFDRWASKPEDLDDQGESDDEIRLCAAERVTRLLIIYAAAASAELSLEAGDQPGVLSALQTACKALGAEYEKLLKIVFTEMAWQHNKEAYGVLFGGRPAGAVQAAAH